MVKIPRLGMQSNDNLDVTLQIATLIRNGRFNNRVQSIYEQFG